MSTLRQYTVMVTTKVSESVCIFAESDAEALIIARYVHSTGVTRHEIDRMFLNAQVLRSEGVAS